METAKAEALTLPTFTTPPFSSILTHRRARSDKRCSAPPCWCSSWSGAMSKSASGRERPAKPGFSGSCRPTGPMGAESAGAKSARLWFHPPPADTPADASRPGAGTSTAVTQQHRVHAGHPGGAHAAEYTARAHSVSIPQGDLASG